MTENAYKKRFLFSVKARQASCAMIYSVAGDTAENAMVSLRAGDQNCKLIYDEVQLGKFEEPEYIGPDTIRRTPNV